MEPDYDKLNLILNICNLELKANIHEIKGPKNNASILKYYYDTGFTDVFNETVPWCAAFVGSVLSRAGIEHSKSLLAKSYLDWGVNSKTLIPGCIAVFDRGPVKSWKGHVAFAIKETDTTVTVIGGNQHDSVSEQTYSKKRLLGYRVPQKNKINNINLLYSERFLVCLKRLLRDEGGVSNNPKDPGGLTNKGITLRTYVRYYNESMSSVNLSEYKRKLLNITDEEVQEIYYRNYWVESFSYRLPVGVDYIIFDLAVNSGPSKAIRILQKAVGAGVDGEYGPQTSKKMLEYVNEKGVVSLINEIRQLREKYYRSLSTFGTFGRGWLNRLGRVYKYALKDVKVISKDTKQPDNNFSDIEEVLDKMLEKELQDIFSENYPNTKTKNWWQSKTIWGVIGLGLQQILPPVLKAAFGVDVNAEMIAQLGEALKNVVDILASMGFITLGVYGRYVAKEKIK